MDLHGNSLKKETTPDGGKDENVFDIRQGVSIALFVKQKAKKGCKVFHADLYGLREVKYDWLGSKDFRQKNYQAIQPETPYYFLIKRDTEKIKEYLNWKSINEIFPVNSVGIVTARDELTIKWSEEEVYNTVLNFSKMDIELARQAYQLGKDARDWKIEFAQKDLQESGLSKANIKPILYRPFDIRYTYYTGNSRGFHCMPRHDVMRHMLENNLGFNVVRQVKTGETWQHCLISNVISESCYLSNKTSEIGYAFPLYIYKDKIQKKAHFHTLMLFEPEAEYGVKDKIPNIDKSVYEKLNNTYKKKLTPEEIFYYIYAVFYSNIYREKYAEFLKIDFPRVPFTAEYKLFSKLSDLGKQLTDLHLMKSDLLNKPITKYQGKGDNDKIEKVTYVEKEQRIYVNKEKFFDNVSPELWDYQIGGYQVLQKYLKDRKGRTMDDPRYYCHIVTAIDKTIALQNQIAEIYNDVEKELIEF